MTPMIAHDMILIAVVVLFFAGQLWLHFRARRVKKPRPLTPKDIENICRARDGKNGASSWK